ncbi:MAG: hypothetical protein KGI27_09330 [Thaumarchaeota archaeon]|nr:hypothetical protein [Nitrososphaerota archaeon]
MTNFTDEDRVYDFYCTGCGIVIRLFEGISTRARERLKLMGCVLEPLTKEEEVEQVSECERETTFREYPRTGKVFQMADSDLDPAKCLRRWCRICGTGMELEYEFDSDERRYTFHCTRCNTAAQLLQEITKEMRKCWTDDCYALEPLTREEESLQNSGSGTLETVRRGRVSLPTRYPPEKKTGMDMHMLSEEEAENLR